MTEPVSISVKMPADQLEQIRRIVKAGGAEDVSAYIADAVRTRLHRDHALSELANLFDRKGHKPSAEHLAWARDVLGVDTDDGGDVS